MDRCRGGGVSEISVYVIEVLTHHQSLRIHKKAVRIQADVNRQGVTDIQTSDERARGGLDFVGSDHCELRLTALVDRYHGAFDDVFRSIEQRLEFLDGQRAVGVENSIDAGHLVGNDTAWRRSAAERT